MRLLARSGLAVAAIAALGVSSFAVAAPRERAAYAGTTDQAKTITLRVKDDSRGVRYEIAFRMPCAGADAAEATAFSARSDRIRPDRAGRFRESFVQEEKFGDGTPYRLTSDLQGKVGKRRAHGTYRGTLTYPSPETAAPVECDSGRVTWTARRR